VAAMAGRPAVRTVISKSSFLFQALTVPAPINVDGAYFVQARLNVNLPGIEQAIAEEIVQTAHQKCPYSKVTRGNINLVIDLL
jgi:lipoyl-dependent peroxiredoxin